MIVKDEEDVIERCLNSCKPIIDYWVIVDTGSSDHTKEIIIKIMQDIPGELHERPWVNFGHNRQEALNLAKKKGDYLLFIDADEVISFEKPLDKSSLTKDAYRALFINEVDNSTFHRILLARASFGWKWVGAIHEYIYSVRKKDVEILENVSCYTYFDGGRSKDPQKCQKDLDLLQKELQKNPHNSRTFFYLAMTYENMENLPKAIKYHKKRTQHKEGPNEEAYYSLFSIGRLEKLLKLPQEKYLKSFSKAYCHRPTRAEPLYYIAKSLMETHHYFLAYHICKTAIALPIPDDSFYVERWIYEWGAWKLFAECSFQLKKYKQTKRLIQTLLRKKNFPEDQKTSLLKCLEFIPN